MQIETVYEILKAINQLKEANPYQIAKKTKHTKQTIHNYIKQLQKLGIITPTRKTTTPSQTTTTYYQLTTKGKTTLDTLNEIYKHIKP